MQTETAFGHPAADWTLTQEIESEGDGSSSFKTQIMMSEPDRIVESLLACNLIFGLKWLESVAETLTNLHLLCEAYHARFETNIDPKVARNNALRRRRREDIQLHGELHPSS